MPSATIPWDLTSARVKMDFTEMEPTAEVTRFNIFILRLSSFLSQRTSVRRFHLHDISFLILDIGDLSIVQTQGIIESIC